MSLSQPIIAILNEFRTAFYEPTWEKILVLIIGTVLARGRRTVTAALRAMGLHTERHFSNYHQVLIAPRGANQRCALMAASRQSVLRLSGADAGRDLKVAIGPLGRRGS